MHAHSALQLPLFFQHKQALLRAIPDSPLAANSSLIDNYLQHYKLDLVSDGVAKTHTIWQSRINGFRIIEQRWQAPTDNGRTLIICHGYFDHTGLYGRLIRWGLGQGFTVHGFDLPGHGLSSGQAAAIDNFDQYSLVLAQIIARENYTHYHLVGQSTGCAVILNYLLNTTLATPCIIKPEQITLLAPLVRSLHWQVMRWLYFLLKPFINRIKRSFVSSSHDEMFNQFLKHNDPLQARAIPLCWLGAMEQWIKTIKHFPCLTFEQCLVIQGTEDRTVDYHYNLPQIQRCLPNAHVELIPGAWHHMVNEQEDYWHKICAVLGSYR
jgi:alpha-beta hydrolase superfamily lysophospholipase